MDSVIFGLTTIVALIGSFYLFGMTQVEFLKKNWVEYRCNPLYMPIAGMVGDDVMTNFTKCTMKGFSDYLGFVMDPVMGEFAVVNETLGEVTSTLTTMRSMMSTVRGGFISVVGSVMGKIQNVMSQTQYIVIRMRTLLARVVGVMYSFLFIFYGGLQSGNSLVNGPVGSTMSFLCFDENTPIQTLERTKLMKDVRIGDRLLNNLSIVTSTYKLDGRGVQMYSLSGILVTGSHKVKHKGKFIRVDKHPQAKKVDTKCPNLVCLNTNTHRISIKNYEFLDFDESEDHNWLEFKHDYVKKMYDNNTSIISEGKTGILPGTKIPLLTGYNAFIDDIKVGDILDNGDIVKGVCCHQLKDRRYVEIEKNVLTSPSTWVYVDNNIVRAEEIGREFIEPRNNYVYVFQLITNSSLYPVINSNNKRIMILDELETTDKYFHGLKDSIITSGRFRGRIVVV